MKTAEEIYSECLEQYTRGDSEINKFCSTQRQLSVYAMKVYANQKLDEATETTGFEFIKNKIILLKDKI